MNTIEVIKNYRDNAQLRASFNELAKKTFWIDFEDWYQNGYWTDLYNPYSIIMDGRVVANVSVNRTDFEWNGFVIRRSNPIAGSSPVVGRFFMFSGKNIIYKEREEDNEND